MLTANCSRNGFSLFKQRYTISLLATISLFFLCLLTWSKFLLTRRKHGSFPSLSFGHAPLLQPSLAWTCLHPFLLLLPSVWNGGCSRPSDVLGAVQGDSLGRWEDSASCCLVGEAKLALLTPEPPWTPETQRLDERRQVGANARPARTATVANVCSRRSSTGGRGGPSGPEPGGEEWAGRGGRPSPTPGCSARSLPGQRSLPCQS